MLICRCEGEVVKGIVSTVQLPTPGACPVPCRRYGSIRLRLRNMGYRRPTQVGNLAASNYPKLLLRIGLVGIDDPVRPEPWNIWYWMCNGLRGVVVIEVIIVIPIIEASKGVRAFTLHHARKHMNEFVSSDALAVHGRKSSEEQTRAKQKRSSAGPREQSLA